MVIFICSVVHGAAHVASVSYQGSLEPLQDNVMHRSGIAALVLLLPTALPMMVGFLKKKVRLPLRQDRYSVFDHFLASINS